MNPERLMQVLLAPIVSEKSTMLADKRNQIAFRVIQGATKPEIKAAVELMFKVEVESVQVLNQKGKAKRFGRFNGCHSHAHHLGLAEVVKVRLLLRRRVGCTCFHAGILFCHYCFGRWPFCHYRPAFAIAICSIHYCSSPVASRSSSAVAIIQ